MAAGLSGPLRGRAARDVSIQIVARVMNLALGVFVTALVVRTLGTEGFGQWSALLGVLGIVGFFRELGLSAVTVRMAAAEPEHEEDWISALLYVQLLLAIPTLLAAVITILLASDTDTMVIAGLVLALNIPTSIPAVLGTVFTARMRNGVPMVTLTFSSIVWGAAVIVISKYGGGLVAFAIAMAATRILSHGLTVIFARRLISIRRPDWERMRRLMVVGAPLAVGSALSVAYSNIDQFLVFTMAGSHEAGLYGSTTRILESWLFIPGSLLITLSPVLAASWASDRQRVYAATRSAFEYLTIASLGLLAFVIVTADPLIELLFTDEFSSAAPGLMVLAGAFVLISYGYLTDNLMIVLDLQVKLLYIAIAGLVANVVANLLLIPPHGYMGAAWSTLGTELLVEALAAYVVFRAMGIRRFGLGRLPRIMLSAALFAGGLLVLRGLDVPFAGICTAAAIAYPALLLGLRAVSVADIAVVVHRRRPAL